MDNYVFDHIYAAMPKFNPVIAEGYAVKEVKEAESYVEHLFKCAQESFPPGLTYDGYRIATPSAEYAALSKKRHGKQEYEFARSDVFMAEYQLSLHGRKLSPQRLLLPFTGDIPEINIRGSKFFISPVLADVGLSVGVNSIFLPLNRDKLTFERTAHTYLIDDVYETDYVYWSDIHHAAKQKTTAGQAVVPVDVKTPLHLYLFCKHGFLETFESIFKTEVKFGYIEDLTPEIRKEYIICTSTGKRPTGVKSKFYRGSNLYVGVKSEGLSKLMSTTLATFFYILDYFPDRIKPDNVADTRLWKIVLGQIIFKNRANIGKVIENIDTHINSVDGYLDDMSREALQSAGIEVRDIYEVFLYISANFSYILSSVDVASMYGKRLTVNRYLLFDINKAISNLVFKLQTLPPNKVVADTMESILARYLKQDIIYGIVNAKHGEVSGVSYPGDNKIFKITSTLVLQAEANGGRGKKNGNLSDPARLFDGSIVEIGSVTNQPKSEPTGRTKVNMFIQIDKDGKIIRDERKRAIVDDLQAKIGRR